MPAVSVVIPTFNRRALICPTVQSVLDQTFADLEIIVVDDGSTDGTPELLWEQFGGRIRIERLPSNQGRSVARNVGAELARGKFIAFLDSDDIWLPSKLGVQMPLFEDPAVVMVHCWVGKIDPSGEWLEAESQDLERQFEIAARRGYGYGGITQTWCRMYTSAVVIRREILRQTGGFDPRVWNFEDWDVLWRVARAGKVATVRQPLVLHRTHPGNTTEVWADAAIQWIAVNGKHLAEIAGRRLGPEDRRARANLLVNMALGEYWRRDLPASRRWMWRALMANPWILTQPGDPVWCAPLLHALMPRALADLLVERTGADPYVDPEGLAA